MYKSLALAALFAAALFGGQPQSHAAAGDNCDPRSVYVQGNACPDQLDKRKRRKIVIKLPPREQPVPKIFADREIGGQEGGGGGGGRNR